MKCRMLVNNLLIISNNFGLFERARTAIKNKLILKLPPSDEQNDSAFWAYGKTTQAVRPRSGAKGRCRWDGAFPNSPSAGPSKRSLQWPFDYCPTTIFPAVSN